MSEKILRKPPRIKVLEAIGSIGDNRVHVISDDKARIVSSSGEREYLVVLKKITHSIYRVYSDDNGTIYRGYIGYPIIAFLMVKGIIPVDKDVMRAMTGIPWKELNEKYKKYSIVENIVMNRAERIGVSRNIVNDYISIVMKKLSLLKLVFDEKLSRQ